VRSPFQSLLIACWLFCLAAGSAAAAAQNAAPDEWLELVPRHVPPPEEVAHYADQRRTLEAYLECLRDLDARERGAPGLRCTAERTRYAGTLPPGHAGAILAELDAATGREARP
jgi:hypothetical protein